MAIWFYSKSPEYGWLSNFSNHKFSLRGIYWHSVEYFYQAQKYLDQEIIHRIRLAESPIKAKKIGENSLLVPRLDWEEVKIRVMEEGIYAKFEQNRKLRELLLATERELLIHYSEHDLFWGQTKDGIGENQLGNIIMEVRQVFNS